MKTITVIGSIVCITITLAALSGCKTDTIEYFPVPGPQANVTHFGGRPAAPPVNVSHYGPPPVPPAPPVNVSHHNRPPVPPAPPANVSHHNRPPVPIAAPRTRVSHHPRHVAIDQPHFRGMPAGVATVTQAGAPANVSHH